MSDRDELNALRRMAELEAKAGGNSSSSAPNGSVVLKPEVDLNQGVFSGIRAEAKKRYEALPQWRKLTWGPERALDEAAMGLKQLTVGLDPQEQRELAIRREMENSGDWYTSLGRTAGDVAMLAGPSKFVDAAAGAVKVGPQILRRALGQGILGGAAEGEKPVIGNESRGNNAALGATLAAATSPIGDAVSRSIRGIVPVDKTVQTLPQSIRDKLTLGQLADPESGIGSFVTGLESRMRKMPIVGPSLNVDRSDAEQAFRDEVLNRVSPPGFTSAGTNTRARVDQIADAFHTQYTDALKNQRFAPSQLFESQLLRMTNDPARMLTNAERDRVRNLVGDVYQAGFTNPVPASADLPLLGSSPGARMTGDYAKGFESKLTDQAEASTNPAIKKLYSDLERAWTTSYRRQMGIDGRRSLSDLDSRYAPFQSVQRAASYPGTVGGDFTPDTLEAAMSSGNRVAFARGNAPLQDLTGPVREVMSKNTGSGANTSSAAGAVGRTALSMTGFPLLAMTDGGKNFLTGQGGVNNMARKLMLDKLAKNVGGAQFPVMASDIFGSNYVPEDQ